MWSSPTVTQAPVGEPVTVASAKVFLKEDGSENDALIQALILSARQHIESYSCTRLITQAVRVTTPCWAALNRLPIGPVQSVTIGYLDAAGAEQVVDAADYELVSSGLEAFVRLKPGKSWPSIYAAPDAIRLTAVVGYGAAEAVPAPVALALQMLVTQWYDNRAAASDRQLAEMPNGVASILSNYRIFLI